VLVPAQWRGQDTDRVYVVADVVRSVYPHEVIGRVSDSGRILALRPEIR
jgi:hypothetical protein